MLLQDLHWTLVLLLLGLDEGAHTCTTTHSAQSRIYKAMRSEVRLLASTGAPQNRPKQQADVDQLERWEALTNACEPQKLTSQTPPLWSRMCKNHVCSDGNERAERSEWLHWNRCKALFAVQAWGGITWRKLCDGLCEVVSVGSCKLGAGQQLVERVYSIAREEGLMWFVLKSLSEQKVFERGPKP